MKLGEIIDKFLEPPHPKGISIDGNLVTLKPLVANQFAEELFLSNAIDKEGNNWTYLPYGPFESQTEYASWVESFEEGDDPVFFAIVSKKLNKAIGIASYLRINPTIGSIEVGHINYSPLLQKTTEATEAMYLMMKWAFEKGEKVFFLPDQHLGRNTAVLKLGLKLSDCVIWNPWKSNGGLSDAELISAKVILWRGHCSVHGRFSVENIEQVRQRITDVKVIVHPECQYEVVSKADVVGSTEMIIKTVTQSPAGSTWAVGTELNLVKRLAANNPDKSVVFLDKDVCYCSTMNRIDLPHLLWAMESLVKGRVVNQIKVEAKTANFARIALDRMLGLP